MKYHVPVLTILIIAVGAWLLSPAPLAEDSRAAASATAGVAEATTTLNSADIATRIVNDVLEVKPGETIQVNTDLSNLELTEELALTIRRSGAFPLIVYGSARLTRRILQETPEAYLASTPTFQVKMLRVVDGMINLASPESPAMFAQVPEHRLMLVRKANQTVAARIQASPLRTVTLGNAGIPSKQQAKFYGTSLEKLERYFWNAVDADPDELQARGERVRAALQDARTLRLTSAEGTNLTMKLVGRPIVLNSGILEPQAVDREHQARNAWLPAGEAYTSPLETAADGVVKVKVAQYRGIKIEDLTLKFREGRVIKVSAAKGAEVLEEALALASGDKDRIAVIDIGLNPKSRLIPGSSFRSYEMEGLVTLGIGGLVWAPTENQSDFQATFFLPNATLEADGRIIVKDGKLKI
ncbi:MAG: aminopeptidase [Acidobacteriota bacterium]